MARRIEFARGVVVKSYRDRISRNNELRIYRLMTGSGLVPNLVGYDEWDLTIRHLDAPTVSEYIDSILKKDPLGGSVEQITDLADMIFEWFHSFENRYMRKTGFRLVHDDMNPRNLLVSRDGVVGIDFERYHHGSLPEACFVMASMLNTMDMPERMGERFAERLISLLSKYSGLMEKAMTGMVVQMSQKVLWRRKAMKTIRESSCGILAGGKGSRMGGLDKSRIAIGGYTFLERILHTVWMFDRIVISADSAPKGYRAIGDIYRNCGPIGALHALLTGCRTEHVLILPCDTPLISGETIYDMYLALDEDSDAVVVRCKGRLYPVIGIYRNRILPTVSAVIREGDYSMRNLLDRIKVKYLDVYDDSEVMNVNTPEEMKRLEEIFALRNRGQ